LTGVLRLRVTFKEGADSADMDTAGGGWRHSIIVTFKPLPSSLTLLSIIFVSIMAESSGPPLFKRFCVKNETVRNNLWRHDATTTTKITSGIVQCYLVWRDLGVLWLCSLRTVLIQVSIYWWC
jgi:hypothetical protein